jgi:hypothetical protein
MHLQANYQLLVNQRSEASASQSVWTIAVPKSIGLDTASNNG